MGVCEVVRMILDVRKDRSDRINIRDKHQCCNYYFFMFRSGCCMKHGVNIAIGISIHECDVRIICIHIFLCCKR